ncbi:unnamed protein product [Microthlaspi erraticum]|uniref:TF-B3 domain-containing protein n=1 Tax=Microthlaspi erraticum TaxID=1685480 RepID=A0A6D2IR06_9BRAS|nr:unnamed protein product [Microthlaspi erraticum]
MVTTSITPKEEDMESEEKKTTSLTPEEVEKRKEAEFEAVSALIQLSKAHPKPKNKKRKRAGKSQLGEVEIAGESADKKQRKTVEKDDSEETLREILRWKGTIEEKPHFLSELDVVGVCSEPTWKQLMESDVNDNQIRLMLGKLQVKKMMLQVMGDTERDGTDFELEVSVYVRGGEFRKMVFKTWKGTPVLTSPEWKKFVSDHKLKKHCDFVTVWMFKHRESRQVCFAVDVTRLAVEKRLSNRIMKITS